MVYSIAVFKDNLSQDENLIFFQPYLPLNKNGLYSDNMYKEEKENLKYVQLRLSEEYQFQKTINYKIPNPNLDSRDVTEQLFGIFICSFNDTVNGFSCKVLWEACFGCVFALLLERNENTELGNNVLKLIIKYSITIFNMTEEKYRQLQLLPEKMTSILHVFLPSGKLIFMNHRIVKHFERELDKIISEKK